MDVQEQEEIEAERNAHRNDSIIGNSSTRSSRTLREECSTFTSTLSGKEGAEIRLRVDGQCRSTDRTLPLSQGAGLPPEDHADLDISRGENPGRQNQVQKFGSWTSSSGGTFHGGGKKTWCCGFFKPESLSPGHHGLSERTSIPAHIISKPYGLSCVSGRREAGKPRPYIRFWLTSTSRKPNLDRGRSGGDHPEGAPAGPGVAQDRFDFAAAMSLSEG